jgi:hypothetical protein
MRASIHGLQPGADVNEATVARLAPSGSPSSVAKLSTPTLKP